MFDLIEALIYGKSETGSGFYTCSLYHPLKESVENEM